LFAIVNLSRFLGVPGEDALRQANKKFTHRFQAIEKELKRKGKTFAESSLNEMDGIWNSVKKNN